MWYGTARQNRDIAQLGPAECELPILPHSGWREKGNTENYLLFRAWVQFTCLFFFGYNKLTLSIVVVQDGLPSSVWNVVGYTQQNKTNKEKRMASSHGSSCQNIAMRIANRSLTSRPASPEGQPKRERERQREMKNRRKDGAGGRFRYAWNEFNTNRRREDQRLSVAVETKTSLINESNGRMRTHKNMVDERGRIMM